MRLSRKAGNTWSVIVVSGVPTMSFWRYFVGRQCRAVYQGCDIVGRHNDIVRQHPKMSADNDGSCVAALAPSEKLVVVVVLHSQNANR